MQTQCSTVPDSGLSILEPTRDSGRRLPLGIPAGQLLMGMAPPGPLGLRRSAFGAPSVPTRYWLRRGPAGPHAHSGDLFMVRHHQEALMLLFYFTLFMVIPNHFILF